MEVIDHVPLIKPLPVVSTRMTPYARQLPPFLVCLGLERSDRLREKLPIVTGGYLLQGMAVEADFETSTIATGTSATWGAADIKLTATRNGRMAENGTLRQVS
jgi:hypothetical protein